MKAEIYITLKTGVLDTQGAATKKALANIGFDNVNSVRQGKFIELEIAETNHDKATPQVTEICEKLLANTVIENYRFEIIG